MIFSHRISCSIAARNSIQKICINRIKDYLIKGFAIDDERLKELGGGSYFKELLDRIRDIRSSEKVFYRQVLDLFSTAVDYNPVSVEAKLFFCYSTK